MKGELAAKALEHGLEKLVEWGKEAVEGFIEIVKGTAETGRELDKTAQMTGLTTKALQELRFAADESGTGADNLSTGVFHLARSMAAAKKGGDEQGAAFKKLGVHVSDAHGKLRNADEVLTDIAGGFAKMPDGIDKTALAIEIFGRSGAAMIPMLNKGKEGLEELRKEAYVMTPEQIAAGKELTLTLEAITRTTKNLWKAAISPMLPAITDLAKRFLAWKKANAELMKQKIQQYIGYLIKIIRVFGSVMDGIIEVMGTLASIFKWIVTGAGKLLMDFFREIGPVARIAALAFAAAWLIAAAPMLALAAVAAGLLLVINSFRRYKEGKDSIVGDWLKMLDDWQKPRDNDTWFVAAIKDFVKLIQEAVRLIDEFYEATGRVNPRTVDRKMGRNEGARRDAAYAETSRAARAQVEAGLPLSEDQKTTLRAHGINTDMYVQHYSPSLGPAAGSAPKPLYVAPVQFQIVQQPGQSADELVDMIDQRIQSHQDTVHEDAAAALGD